MAELDKLSDVRLGGEINMADATLITYKNASIPGTALQSAADVARSQLDQDDAKPYPISLHDWRATGTGAILGTAAGTPSGAFGLTVGTHGSASATIVGESASGNSKTNLMRHQFVMPAEYVDGETVTLRIRCKITADANTAQTLDVEVHEPDGAAGVGSDICASAAQTITDAYANYDFTITPTSVAAGDVLDIEVTGVANDTGGTTGSVITIAQTIMLLDVKG